MFVVNIGVGESHSQKDALAIGQVMPFGAEPGAIDGVAACEVTKIARKGRVDYLLVESTGIPEPLPAAEPRLGRRTVLTFPLGPPPQKN